MRVSRTLLIFAVLTSMNYTARASPAAGPESQAVATYPRNQTPMYGGTPPSPEEKAADDAFIAQAISLKGNRSAGSDASVVLGFDYLLKRQDPATAMKRFNQAFLLDPNNGAAYQGMAITELIRDHDAAQAEALFKRAAAASRVNPDIFADYGRFLLQSNRPAEAIPVLKRGVALDETYVETGSLLAAAFFDAGRKADACPLARKWQPKAQPSIAQTLTEILKDPACR